MPDNKIELILEAISKGFPELSKKMDGIRDDLTGLKNEAGKVQGGIDSLIKTFGGLAIATVIFNEIKNAARESLRFLGQMETSALGIATAYMVGGKYIDQTTGKALEGEKALKAAQQDAKSMLDELQVANLQTIATLDQLVRAYQETLPVAMAKGFDKRMAKDFTVAMVQAAGAIGLPLDQMGEETRSILTGNINPRTSRIATVLGLRNEDVRKVEGDANKLFTFLMEKLDAYKLAGIESQNTWAGLWSNAKDIALQAGGQVFQPLFDVIKQQLSDITNKIVTINKETNKIEWNKDFLKGIETFRDFITETIADVHRLAMLLDKIGGTLTAIPRLVAQGINYTFFLGQFKGLDKGSQKFVEWNKMFEDRYNANDRALQDMAMRREGFKPATQEQLAQLDYASPEAAGLTRVVSELGQVLYYYKEINKEKTGYKTNPQRQTEEQIKALENWQKKLRDLQTDIDKTAYHSDELSDKILDIENKYKDLVQEADKSMREHKVKLDKSLLDRWKEAMIGKAQWEKQWKEYEEAQKKREEGEKKYKSLVEELQTSTGNEQENRIQKSIQEETKLTKELGEIWSSTEMTYEEYQMRLAQIEAKGVREREKINEEFNLAILEAESRRQLAVLDLAEKEMSLPKADIAKGRIEEHTKLLEAYVKQREKAIERNDLTAQFQAESRIDETRAKINELTMTVKELTGSFGEGFNRGLTEFLWNVKTSFQMAKEIATETATAMQQSFSDFFFDAFEGKLKSLSDYLNSFLSSVKRAMANALGQQVTGSIISGIGSLFGSTPASSGSSGTPTYHPSLNPGGTQVAHTGGTVRRYIPVFHAGGLNSDERMVINRVGERYITEEQNEWLTNIARSMDGTSQPIVTVQVNIDNKTGLDVKQRETQTQWDGKRMIKNVMIELADKDRTIKNIYGIKDI